MKLTISLVVFLVFSIVSFAQNFWQQLPGPDGGDINCFAFQSGGNMYATTSGGGVYLSTNNGTFWINKGLNASFLYEIKVNSVGDLFVSDWMQGMLRSSDSGNSWEEINNGLTGTSVYTIAINSSNYIFVATYAGIFRSTNNGSSWTLINNQRLLKN